MSADAPFEWASPVDVPSAGEAADRLLPLVHEAGNPYYDWFFGDPAAARAALREWLVRPSAEVFVGRSTALVQEGELAGFFIALSGRELAAARLADLVAARRLLGDAARERIASARGLFGPVDPDDWYLSVIAVAGPFRGRGLGRRLLDRYVEVGLKAGHTRFMLDVDARRDPANALYTSAGFREFHRAATADAALEYRALVRDQSSS